MAERIALHDGRNVNASEPARAFLANLSVFKGSNQRAWFLYVATRENGEMAILKGQILFLPERPSVPAALQLTEQIQAGCIELKKEKGGLEGFLSLAGAGVVPGPLGQLTFYASQDHLEVIHSPSIPEAHLFRWSSLTLRRRRAQISESYKSILDWGLKSARVPYDTLDEVALVYKCGPVSQEYRLIDIVAPNVAAISENSSVAGEVANIQMNIWDSLDERKATLGYRVVVRGECVERGTKESSYFSWRTENNIKIGTIGLVVPVSSLVHCYAIYDNVAQHSWFIGDRSNSQNPRRVAFESFDPALIVETELLSPMRKGKSREFESGIAALLWMLGFSVVHLNDPRHSDAVDLIATGPDGNVALIECTTGLLREESKLANLVSRAYSVRQRLNASGSSHLVVLPIIITSKVAGEISHELDAAHRQGVAVMAREDVLDALDLTVLLPNPNQWFQNMLDQLQERRARLES